MKKYLILCVAFSIAVLCVACGTKTRNGGNPGSGRTPGNNSANVTATLVSQDENDPNFNHGHSISETDPFGQHEIRRSTDILIHNENEALDFLQDSFKYNQNLYTFELTDTSANDPGAYMWYEFTVYHDGIPVENSEFRVVAFTDGTIAEGRIEFFRCSLSDRTNLLSRDEALDLYIKNSGDNRAYVYQDEHYFFVKQGVCPYVYVYRFENGKMAENTTLSLDAETGEMVGYRPDAILE